MDYRFTLRGLFILLILVSSVPRFAGQTSGDLYPEIQGRLKSYGHPFQIVRKNSDSQRNPHILHVQEPLLSFDILETNESGTAHFVFVSPNSGQLDLGIEGDTRIVITNIDQNRGVELEMVQGLVSFDAPLSSPALVLNSPGMVVNIADGQGQVQVLPWGDVLVSAQRGRVIIRTPEGLILFAQPGASVEFSDGFWRIVTHDVDCTQTFHGQWRSGRTLVFLNTDSEALFKILEEYNHSRDRFLTLYTRLMDDRQIFLEWIRLDNLRQPLRNTVDRSTIESISRNLQSLAVFAPVFEQQFLGVKFMEINFARFHEGTRESENPIVGTILGGLWEIRAEFPAIEGRLRELRHIQSLFNKYPQE